MIKHRIAHGNAVIEFLELSAAEAYKADNALDAEIETFESEETIVPTHIPDVTPRQFRQALILSGISTGTIEAAINAQSEPLKSLAMIEWEYSTAFKRDNPLVAQMAPSLGFTSEMLDQLWLLAGTL